MKYRVSSEFFCSYFYHAGVAESRAALSHFQAQGIDLEAMYSSMAAVVLLQGTLESYINFLIHTHDLANKLVNVDSKCKKLSQVGIKDKWRHVPALVSGRTFDENDRPWRDFVAFVGLRNDLVHFKAERFSCEIELPADCRTPDQIRHFVSQPGVLADHILYDVLTMGFTGPNTVKAMLEALHLMLGSPSPSFLESEEILKMERIH